MIIGSLRVLSSQCSRQSNDSLALCRATGDQRGKAGSIMVFSFDPRCHGLADMNSAADPTWLRGAFRRRLNVAAYKRCNCLAERQEKSQNSRSVVSFGSRLSATRWIPNSADFFLRPILEYDMATFTRSQKLLVSAGAAALGGAALVTLLAGNIVTLAGATALDISPPFSAPHFPSSPPPAP